MRIWIGKLAIKIGREEFPHADQKIVAQWIETNKLISYIDMILLLI